MSRLSTNTPSWVDGVLRALFPPACIFCGGSTAGATAAGRQVCTACARAVRVRPPHCCVRCGRMLPADLAPGPCGRCLARAPAQAATHSLYVYDGPVRQAILAWKLHGDDAGLHWLLAAAAGQLRRLLSADDLLLPVPMPMSRMRHSGQHHAAALCKNLAGLTDCQWDRRILRRIGEQPRQSALSGQARRRNLARAFAVDTSYVEAYAVRFLERGELPERLWLVDDILTTGATAHYAARALTVLDRPVHVLTLARAGRIE